MENDPLYIHLPDGRRLSYAISGDPAGKPVLFCHGWGESRHTCHPDHRIAADLGICLITIDRPGIGRSDFQANRCLLDWAEDVRQVVDQLGIQRFALLAHSGGGPHALAVALCMPQRVSSLAIVSGLAPMDRPDATVGMALWMKIGHALIHLRPEFARVLIPPTPGFLLDWVVKGVVRWLAASPCIGNRLVMRQAGVAEMFAVTGREAVYQGTMGMAHDLYLILGKPWGFGTQDVHASISLWYGEDDDMATPQMGHYLASQLTGCRLRLFPNEGHLLYLAYWEEILTDLVAEGG